MADEGHRRTDKMIAEIEKRLKEEYTQAAKEIEKKLHSDRKPRGYFDRFAWKDAKWAEFVKNGKKRQAEIDEWKRLVRNGQKTQQQFDAWCVSQKVRTPEAYAAWRMSQIAAGDRWEIMQERIASDILNTNKIAQEIVNREMPSIFGLNANYALYQVEHDARIDTSLTLYSRETVDMILRDDPDLLLPPGRRVQQQIRLGKAKRWEKQHIQSVMIQGILQGESIPNLARRLAEKVADSDYKAMIRNTRTMATNAQNAGRYDAYDRLKKNGVDLTLEWAATLDNRTRHEHRMMHGQRRNVGEPFVVDGIEIMYPAQTGTFKGVSDIPQSMIWNCRCTILAWVKGYEHDTIKTSDKMGEMTFDEWLEAKPKPQNILSQYEKGEAMRQKYLREYGLGGGSGGKEGEKEPNYTVQSVKDGIAAFFKSGDKKDLKKLANDILEQFGNNGLTIRIKKLRNAYGEVRFRKNRITNMLTVVDYNLLSTDARSTEYRIRTAFHEAFHATSDGRLDDSHIIGNKMHTRLEETFAEASAHYMCAQYGITGLQPSYAEYLASTLPVLKKLPEYSKCNVLADFGKVAYEERVLDKKGQEWSDLGRKVKAIKFDQAEYNKNYVDEIDDNAGYYLDKFMENSPDYEIYRPMLQESLKKAIENVRKGYSLHGNQATMYYSAMAFNMVEKGVK